MFTGVDLDQTAILKAPNERELQELVQMSSSRVGRCLQPGAEYFAAMFYRSLSGMSYTSHSRTAE